METALPQNLTPDFSFSDEILQDRHIAVTDCYQCTKCSSGCPLTFAMDLLPHQIIRLSALGQKDLVLSSNTIWVCSACETCTTRCPNDIDIAGVMDYLKEQAVKSGRPSPQRDVLAFHRSFLADIRLSGGRLNEPLLMGLFALRRKGLLTKLMTGAMTDDLKLGFKMFQKGRLSIKPPQKVQAKAELKNLFKKAKS
ncbi:4Fe-4S dicluster domain-containing protein [Desulfobacca acetoxidans]|uniref:Heterodisulfide reductase, C subunit n=1 Tax=Desulfobacca acetoxidans (strain ATCC 700848 / DSM 11109 / ASRB2) TaxID=880072 RepID=F2NGD6_DESAR|nr:4Fe-4S dicluster domain-containing protein [Desulfobacca acetoxidans]AEB08549.1 heterodisulfide reductase, C subunit [Desulfobacca acetoxidans DSM 11109]